MVKIPWLTVSCEGGYCEMSPEVACVGRLSEGGDVCCGVRNLGVVAG